MFRTLAVRKNLDLLFKRGEGVPRFIRTDPLKLRQVLINLLSNALKFTHKGGITLSVDGGEKDKEIPTGKTLLLTFGVQDTGTGFAPEESAKIFEAFEQVDSINAPKEGTGLGLTISRSFVELMGGHMTAKSETGRGAFFQFDILVKAATVAAVNPMPSFRKVIALEPGQPRYRILVADENPVSRRLLIRLLEIFQFDLQEAENGKHALDLFESWHPHLIFMEMDMPVLDGYEATRQIRSADDRPQPRIIALSARPLKNEQERILVTGCDDYMAKPLMEADIYRVLKNHLGIHWVYEDDFRPEGPSIPVATDDWQALLSPVPNVLREKLRDALLRADMNGVDLSIVKIADYSPSLAVKLQQWAHEFEYETILSFLKGVHHE